MNEKVTVLGAWGTADVGETSSFLVESSEINILLDMCPGAARQLKRYEYQMKNLDFAYGSHVHADHLLGATYLLFQHSVETKALQNGEYKEFSFLGTKDVLDTVVKVISLHYPDRKFRYNTVYVEKSKKLNYNGAVISFAQNNHVVNTHGIRIDFSNGKSICYTADGLFTEDIISLAQDVDLLIGEAFGTEDLYGDKYKGIKHSLATQLGYLADTCNVKQLIPFHMNSIYDTNSQSREKLYEEIRSYYKKEIIWPQDLKTISL